MDAIATSPSSPLEAILAAPDVSQALAKAAATPSSVLAVQTLLTDLGEAARFLLGLSSASLSGASLASFLTPTTALSLADAVRVNLKHLDSQQESATWLALVVFHLEVLRLLATSQGLVRAQLLTMVLPLVVKGVDHRLKANVIIIVATYLEVSPTETRSELQQHLELLVEMAETSLMDFSQLVVLLAALFPVAPDLCCALFLAPAFQAVLHRYYTGKVVVASSQRQAMLVAVLECFAEACVDETCRKVVCAEFGEILWTMTETPVVDIQMLSALILVKIHNESRTQEQERAVVPGAAATGVSQSLKVERLLALALAQVPHTTHLSQAVEILAYLALLPKFRKRLRADVVAIEALLSHLQKGTSAAYGILSVLENLTNLHQPGEDPTERFMKAYARQAQTGLTEEADESNAQIASFSRALLVQHKLVSLLSGMGSPSPGMRHALAKLIYNMAWPVGDVPAKHEIVIQGGLTMLIKYLMAFSEHSKGEGSRPEGSGGASYAYALRALAKVLIGNNPALAFNEYSVLTVVPFLVELLGDGYSALDAFEAVLALTNLASVEDAALKHAIVMRSFDRVYALLFTSANLDTQVACLELVNNLMASPLCLERFFNFDTAEPRARLDYLILQTDSPEERIQSIALGVLINATAYDFIGEILVGEPKLVAILGTILAAQAQSRDLVFRVSHLLVCLAQAALASQRGPFKATLGSWRPAFATCIRLYSGDQEIAGNLVELLKAIS